jgi:hypothetical protein
MGEESTLDCGEHDEDLDGKGAGDSVSHTNKEPSWPCDG